MASETSTKAKLGTAIAFIGGAVGIGIVIYALLGGEKKAIISETSPDVASPEVKQASDQQVGTSEPPKAETSSQTVTDTPTEDAPLNTDVQDPEPQQRIVDNEAPDTSEEPPQVTDTSTDETGVETSGENTAERAPEQAPSEPQTEMASVAEPTPEIPSVEPTAPAPVPTTQSDAPVVESSDPVMGLGETLILQTAPAPTNEGPTLDASDPSVPKFDLVRIEADGSAVIAGRASPNADVQILSNGEEIGTAKASPRGEFVALIDTEVTTTARSLALIADGPSGDKIASQSNVIVLARTASEIDNSNEEISLAPAIVQATPDAVRVIQPVVGLADLDRVSLDTISYDEAGQVILAGRGRPGFTARVYASGSSISDSKISRSGTWSATINNLDEGRYVIRVDELDPQGEVASRVESPFQRIFPTAEQLALLTDATSVIVQPGNNLWTIAEGRYGIGFRYTTIFEANKEQIRDPDLIYPGQVFELPEDSAQ